MKRFIQGEHRTQNTLFPETLDDYVTECNPVRVVEVFVEGLDLGVLGFEGIKPEATGRPAYHPATLLKIYIYGYLNRIQSTRRLEMETQRNVELMWLTSRLTPDFKTIARFRKENGKAIRSVCRQFVELCRQLDLFWVRLFSAKKFRLSCCHFEFIILRYRNIIALVLLTVVKDHVVLKITASAKGA